MKKQEKVTQYDVRKGFKRILPAGTDARHDKAADILYYSFMKAFSVLDREPVSRKYVETFGEYLIHVAKVEVKEHLHVL